MKIISITKQDWRTENNAPIVKEYPILFNTNEMITAETSEWGGTRIEYKKAMVGVLYCKETLEEVTNIINNCKHYGEIL
jgi:hypothetical protein